jgi:hypothetical protein
MELPKWRQRPSRYPFPWGEWCLNSKASLTDSSLSNDADHLAGAVPAYQRPPSGTLGFSRQGSALVIDASSLVVLPGLDQFKGLLGFFFTFHFNGPRFQIK